MFSGTGKNLKEFETQAFRDHQKATESIREIALKPLGLRPDQINSFYVILKKDTTDQLADHRGTEELQATSGLCSVYPVELPGVAVDKDVVAKTRGAVLYKYGFRIGLPIETPPDILKVDQYIETPRGVSVDTGFRTIYLQNPTVRLYEQGTVMRMFKINGQVVWMTQHNVLPGGASHARIGPDGKVITTRLHKQAKRADWIPSFTSLIEGIAEDVDPTLITGKGWFPEDCAFSNKEYRFILCHPALSPCMPGYCGPKGYLRYIGCFEQWSNDAPPPGVNIGVPHEGYTNPDWPLTIPEDLAQFTAAFGEEFPRGDPVPEYTKGFALNRVVLTPEEANGILSGISGIADKRLNYAGKVIVTGTNPASGATHTFHFVSTAYEHRQKILGDEASLYTALLDLLDKQDYNLDDPEQRKIYFGLFPAVVLPGEAIPGKQATIIGGPPELHIEIDLITMSDLENTVRCHGTIPIAMADESYTRTIGARDIRFVWFNLLLASNLSMRPIVYRYFLRYLYELQGASAFLAAGNFGVTSSDKEKNAVIQKFQKARKLALGNARNLAPKEQQMIVFDYFRSNRATARKIISLWLKISNKEVKRYAVRIAEPNAIFFD